MILQKTTLDTSQELQVYRFGQGIKLSKPDIKAMHAGHNYTLGTVSSLLALPCSVYFETADGIIQMLNERNVEFCGLDSVTHAIGKRYFDLLPRKTVDMLRYNDHLIMRNEVIKIFEEDIFQLSDQAQKAITVKSPWYGDKNKVIGLFGVTVMVGKDELVESLSAIAKVGLLNSNSFQVRDEKTAMVYLPKQQLACARLLLSGMTNKQIASKLDLSPRTVESYINNIKSKFRCRNKIELIVKLSRILPDENINC